MAIKIGDNTTVFKVGSDDCKIYLGNTLLYSPTPQDSGNVITYTASAKLLETTTVSSGGLHTYAFSGTSGQLTITSHTFSNGVGTIVFNGDVKRVGTYAFFKCSGATSITIPSSVSVFENQPFWGCISLTDITIKATTAPTFNGFVFDNTNNCNINVPCNSLVDYASVSYDLTSRLKGISPCTNKVRYYNSGTTCHNYDLYQVVALQLSTDNGSTWSYVSPAVTQEYLLEENSEDCGYVPPTSGDNVITYTKFQDNTPLEFEETEIKDENGDMLSVDSHTYDDMAYSGVIVFNGDIYQIGQTAFANSIHLESIVLPSTITTIGDNAFENCTSLTTCTIGSGVTSINNGVFYFCSSLSSATINAPMPPSLGNDVFSMTPIADGDGWIYVPDESVMDYQIQWGNYASQIRGISEL